MAQTKKIALLLIFSLFFYSGLFSEETPAETTGFWLTSSSVKPEAKSAYEENMLRWRSVSLWKADGTENLGVSKGIWKLKATRENPMIYSPLTKIVAENQPIATFRMKLGKGLLSKGCFLFITDTQKDWSDATIVVFDLASDGEFHDYEVDMSKNPLWKGKVTQLRFQVNLPWPTTEEIRTIELESLQFPDLG